MRKFTESECCPKCGMYYAKRRWSAEVLVNGMRCKQETLFVECFCGYETSFLPMDAKEPDAEVGL